MIVRDGLHGPESYWCASDSERRQNCNGCGTGGWQGAFVPDTIYGLRISEACNIHDWMYAEGVTERDREIADLTFHENIVALIERRGRQSLWAWLVKPFRLWRAQLYYEAVRRYGRGPFEVAKKVE